MAGFQVGRMSGNPLLQGFQLGSNIKQSKKDEAFRLKEHERMLQQQKDLQEYRLRQEDRFDLTGERAHETSLLTNEAQSMTNDAKKSSLLSNQLLDSGSAYLSNNVFNEFGENEAENFFTKNDKGDFAHNESFNPQSYGYGVGSTKTLDNTVDYLSQQDAYKDMDKDKIRSIISKNWEGDEEGSQNIYGDQRDELYQNSTAFIQKAFLDDIKGLDADGVNKVKKLYGTNQNAFNMITPGLDAAGYKSDQYNIGLGGDKVALNMNPESYDRNAALLQKGYYKENADGSFEYKPYDIKVPGSEKEAINNKAEEILNQPYDSTTYSKVKKLGVNLEKDTNARQLYFGNLGREYQGYDETLTGIGVSPLEFNREGTKVSVNLDTMLDIGGDDMTYDIKYDKTGAPYFNFSPVIDDYDNKTHMSILTTGLAMKPNNETPARKIYLDDSWVKEGAKSLTDYINKNMEANMPGMNNLFGGLSF